MDAHNALLAQQRSAARMPRMEPKYVGLLVGDDTDMARRAAVLARQRAAREALSAEYQAAFERRATAGTIGREQEAKAEACAAAAAEEAAAEAERGALEQKRKLLQVQEAALHEALRQQEEVKRRDAHERSAEARRLEQDQVRGKAQAVARHEAQREAARHCAAAHFEAMLSKQDRGLRERGAAVREGRRVMRTDAAAKLEDTARGAAARHVLREQIGRQRTEQLLARRPKSARDTRRYQASVLYGGEAGPDQARAHVPIRQHRKLHGFF